MPEHVAVGAPFPEARFAQFPKHPEPEPVFNPAIHLQLEDPAWLKPLISEYNIQHGCDHPVAFPVEVRPTPGGMARSLGPRGATVPFPGLAFSSSFRVLSDEGIRVVRSIIDRHEHLATSNDRQPKSLRGLGHRSKFIRDLTYCPEVLAHLSKMGGAPMHPHDMTMNVAQINWGRIGGTRPVDKWHLDSVPYVMVLLMSDATGMEGGKLMVARLKDPKEALRQVVSGQIDQDTIEYVNYPGPGHAIYMQGSYIAHSAGAVKAAREPRITLVNSYQTLNPFAPVQTCYRTFKLYDPIELAEGDVARHYAWRAYGQLDYLLKRGLNGPGSKNILAVLESAAAEIKKARGFVTGDLIDDYPYKVDTEDDFYKRNAKAKNVDLDGTNQEELLQQLEQDQQDSPRTQGSGVSPSPTRAKL